MADFIYSLLVILVGIAGLLGVLYLTSTKPAREHFQQQRKRDASCESCPPEL